jgi:predicted ATPase
MLSSVHIQGFKSLKDVTIDLEPITVFVGPNGSGKTSALDALLSLSKESTQNIISSSPSIDDNLKSIKISLKTDNLHQKSPSSPQNHFLEPNGHNLPTVINYLSSRRDGVLEAIEEDLRAIFSTFERVYTEPTCIGHDLNGQPISGYFLEICFKHIGQIPACDVGEGVLLALGMLTFLHTQPYNIFLLDDMERGLHPCAQQILAQILRKLQEKHQMQLILSTHSPDLVNEFSPQEVRVFGRAPDGYAAVRALKDHPEAGKWLDVMRAGEFWSTAGEDWIAKLSVTKAE